MNGIVIIDKPKGVTSRDIVNIISKKFNIKKVGHTGTLDPIATGVLVVCIGSATKLVDILTSTNKQYIASVKLGIETDTLDLDGTVIKEEDIIIDKEKIKEVLSSFKGKYLQEVPKYSAVKINGKKLYEYARNNEEVTLPKREVEIKDIYLKDYKILDNKTYFSFVCDVSKGTYIRSLIRDIAYKLNTIGIMTDLRRTKQGKFNIEESCTIDNLNTDKIINIIDVLDVKKVNITSDIEKKILNGNKINNIYNSNEVLFIKNNEAIALYKDDNNVLKPYIMFKGGN